MENGISWDQLHMSTVFLVASKSKDPRTHVGAVIVDTNNHPVSTGFNGLPRKVNDLPERYSDRDLKKYFIEHAERNAIYAANESLDGCTMYVNFFPCCDCARGIIQSGIKELVAHKPFCDSPEMAHYKESQIAAETMLKEAGVLVRYYDGELTTNITGKLGGADLSLSDL